MSNENYESAGKGLNTTFVVDVAALIIMIIIIIIIIINISSSRGWTKQFSVCQIFFLK